MTGPFGDYTGQAPRIQLCREPLQIRFVPDPGLPLAGEERLGLVQDERSCATPPRMALGRIGASGPGRHDLAERHLSSALEIAETFGWDYHRASVLIFLAGCRRRRLGELDTQAHTALDQAARICTAHGLPKLLATIEEMRR